MNKSNKKYKFLIIIFTLIIIGLIFASSLIGNKSLSTIKSLIPVDQRELIKKYIFPYKFISQQDKMLKEKQKKIDQQDLMIRGILSKIELDFKFAGNDINLTKSNVTLSNNKVLEKFKFNSAFYAGINNITPGSGYIDFFEDNIFVLSSRGILAYAENLSQDNIKFKQIKNNINNFIDLKQFSKDKWFSIKDIHISNNQIFISYTDELEENCWNTSIIYGDLNYEKIRFNKLFASKKCVHSSDNIDNEFNAHQSGGRIVSLDENNIFFTIGEYRSRYLAQDSKSVNGKIIKINLKNNDHEIISMGHRNPQGLYFDKEGNFLIETEHGPKGGDEINLIDLNELNKIETLNYGWPIASYGEHYGGKVDKNKKRYEKYPLKKSHIQNGFIEPLKSFQPSIGISEVVKINKNSYVTSSLKDKSLYFFDLNKDKKIINLDRVEVFERVRDLRFYDNKLHIFLEDTASIGIINFDE